MSATLLRGLLAASKRVLQHPFRACQSGTDSSLDHKAAIGKIKKRYRIAAV